MFTGIVTHLGRLVMTEPNDRNLRLMIDAGFDTDALPIGASVAVNGICLTVMAKTHTLFVVEASAETQRVTTLGGWHVGDRLNLERALRAGDELGGHVVSGHVDGVAQLIDRRDEGGSTWFTLAAPADLMRFVAHKGSVTLDGTSLTSLDVAADRFSVALIPHTLAVTTWGEAQVGRPMNLEIDLLARYAARWRETA